MTLALQFFPYLDRGGEELINGHPHGRRHEDGLLHLSLEKGANVGVANDATPASLSSSPRSIIDDSVRLVQDLLLDNFFDDVLQGDDADGLVGEK